MNTTSIAFITIAFQIFAVLFAQSTSTVNTPSFPEFEQPTQQITTFGGCNWWVLCTNALVDVVFIIATSIVWFAQLIFGIIKYILDFFVFLATVTFTGVQGAPWWVNALLYLPFGLGTAVIIYRLIRKGDSSDA